MHAQKIVLVLALLIPASYSIKCQKCDSAQGDCNTGVCDGVWCVVSVSENKATRARTVRKDCATANPAGGKDDGCVKDTTADGTENYRCACNSGDNCNSEAGIARMQAMLNNQFSLPGQSASGAAPGATAFGGQPSVGQPSSGQPSSGQAPQVPPGLVNPNSTFTDVLSNQPNPFNGQQPGQPLQPSQPQPQPGQFPTQPQPGTNPGVPPQPNASNPLGAQPTGQFPINTNQPFPQGPGPVNLPPPNQNKPVTGTGHEPETGFVNLPGALPPNTNTVDVHNGLNGTDSTANPTDARNPPATNDLGPVSGQSRSGAVNVKSSMRTCACTEPACNGPCKGDVCYMMTFAANDVRNQAFASKQGQIIQSGCTDDGSVLAEGSHHVQRQISNYRFKVNGQEITVPASATYCNDSDYCNSANIFKSTVLIFLAAFITFFIRF